MRNKKILNICLLTFGLLTLITFILPIKKFTLGESGGNFVKVMFYLLNAIMLASIVVVIVMSIINLFKDNYTKVKFMEMMAMLGFVMVYLVLLIFACSRDCQIYIGYLLVSIEIFVCANFSQMTRFVNMGSQLKDVMPSNSDKQKSEEKSDNQIVVDNHSDKNEDKSNKYDKANIDKSKKNNNANKQNE